MKKVTAKQMIALRHELGMTGEQFGALFGFSEPAKIRISEIENETRPISKHVAVIFRLIIFLRDHDLLKKFQSTA